jgi:hypothetical protein
MEGSHYCLDRCLDRALTDAFQRGRYATKRGAAPRRIPLGLLLLSRDELTVQQLRTALEAQRSAGHGRIGEWLQTLGFVSEHQVTAALARQWSCPVLRANFLNPGIGRTPQIPVTLQESFVMLPVDYVQATRTLHVAFAEGIDYSVLYTIEQMLGCHTEPCLASPSQLYKELHVKLEHRGENELVFEGVADVGEFSRIVRSYVSRVAASEIRLASCGTHIWVRLLRPSRNPLDLLLRWPREATTLAPISHRAGTVDRAV